MDNIVLEYVAPSTFIEFEALFEGDTGSPVKPEWTTLLQDFVRNKVFFYFNVEDSNRDDIQKYFEDIFEEILRFCDKNVTGVWSFDLDKIQRDEGGTVTTIGQPKILAIKINVMFENRQDRDLFARDCALLMRLSK